MKPSNLDTIKYLTNELKVKNLNKSSIVRRGVVRPCFHPSGAGIIKIVGNKITMSRIPEIKSFSLLPVLDKTVMVLESSPMEARF